MLSLVAIDGHLQRAVDCLSQRAMLVGNAWEVSGEESQEDFPV